MGVQEVIRDDKWDVVDPLHLLKVTNSVPYIGIFEEVSSFEVVDKPIPSLNPSKLELAYLIGYQQAYLGTFLQRPFFVIEFLNQRQHSFLADEVDEGVAKIAIVLRNFRVGFALTVKSIGR